MLAAPHTALFTGVVEASAGPDFYVVYTATFGLLTLIFTWALWMRKRWGWFCTIAVSVFVIVADSLTLLDLPSVPGIPKFAGIGEISYSIVVLLYLMQAHIRATYSVNLAWHHAGEKLV